MKRINLKELKQALDKIPDEQLEECYIMHPYATETTDEDELMVIKMGDDYQEFFDKYDTKIISEFATAVFKDAKKIIKVISNPETAEDYADDFPD